MNNNENYQAVEDRPELPIRFRDDLRQPHVEWGRCGITGEWAPVVAVDLGDLSIEAPQVDKGVEYDPETKEVIFTCWRPVRFNTQVAISKRGLEMLLNYMENQDVPVPSVTPHLVYGWEVMYRTGDALRQFEFDATDCKEIERHSGDIDWPNVQQMSIVPREGDLPTYTYVATSKRFWRGGEDITAELDFDGEFPEDATPYYARKVTHTFGSVIKADSMERDVTCVSSTVLQLLGWEHTDGRRCIISIDVRGNWRPWSFEGG